MQMMRPTVGAVRDDRPRVLPIREVARGPTFSRIDIWRWLRIFTTMTAMTTTHVHTFHIHIVVYRRMIAIGNGIGKRRDKEDRNEYGTSSSSPHRRVIGYWRCYMGRFFAAEDLCYDDVRLELKDDRTL